jgi:hypothetical protein
VNLLLTYTDTAARLGTDLRTVRGLVVLLGLPTHPVPRNGNAKGLDARAVAALEAAIAAGRERARAS